MPTLGAALRAVRERYNESQRAFSERLGLSAPAISLRESDKVGVPTDDLQRLVQLTGISLMVTPDGWQVVEPPDQFPANPDRDERYVVRPNEGLALLGRVGAGPARVVNGVVEEWVDLTRQVAHQVDVVLRVDGDSMEPFLQDGDLVGVRLGGHIVPGDVVVAEVGHERAILVKVYRGFDNAGREMLQSLNPPWQIITLEHEDRIRGPAWSLTRLGPLRVPDY
jgi:SOS-response transcriptional repressor LexA